MTIDEPATSVRILSVERVLPATLAFPAPSVPDAVPFDGQDLAMPRMNMHCSWFLNVHDKPHLAAVSFEQIAQQVRTGLASFIAQFPAATGQAKLHQDDSRWWLHYNGQGADLHLAQVDAPLGDTWKGLGAKMDGDLAPRGVVIHNDEDSLFAVKLTRFSCGSLCLSTSTHHWLVDFVGYLDLMDLFGRAIADPSVRLPARNWSRNMLDLVKDTPPASIPGDEWFKERTKQAVPTRQPGPCRNLLLLFTADDLERLKQDMGKWAADAGEECAPPHQWISTNDALHALLWSSISRVRGLEGDSRRTRLHTPLDGRIHVPRSLDKDAPYVGNVHPAHVMSARADEVVVPRSKLFELAWRVRNEYTAPLDAPTMSAIVRDHNYAAEGSPPGFGSGRMPNQSAMFGDDVTISNVGKMDLRKRLDFGRELGGSPSSMCVLGIPAVQMGPLTLRAADGTALILPAPETWTSYEAALSSRSGSYTADEVARGECKGKPGMLVLVGLREQEVGGFLGDELVSQFCHCL
ncbi:bahd family acyltransferase [Pseudozyma flocculosa PF-1]|uniref:Putative BAHD family acyltransferase n=1 Tax=Pseudozyma flocculosa TaxID=84751 RepID=E2JKE6_9BASI|nr:bahd family acyltransferase [Pseudozyma flocculosa PF-1]ADN97218.1 putative BAHD family acyltransferase [Pseudozyma flocculosa]EPQ31818.1 bahd family acyltransferase [Pseudozyma flocculosa PF-1]SPO35287.1 related to Ustilagic Acid acyltransferase [Pseudozyma flocculosa]